MRRAAAHVDAALLPVISGPAATAGTPAAVHPLSGLFDKLDKFYASSPLVFQKHTRAQTKHCSGPGRSRWVRVRQIAFRCRCVVRAISLRHGLQQSHDLRFLRSCVCLKRGTNRSPPDRIPPRATLRTGFIVRRRLPQHLNGNGAMAIVGDAAHTALHAERVGAPDDRSTR
jgi:hypothetical protein